MEGVRAWLARNRLDVALAVFAVVVLAPIVARDSAQPASRLALTAALAEHATVDIDGYPVGVDRALYNGHLRSDKAPLQPVLGVPVYIVARAVGAEPASHKRITGNLTLWSQTVFSSLIPFAALLVLMRRAAARYAAPGPALAVTLALGFGSLLLPYAVNLFGHALAAAFAFGAWLALDGHATERRPLVLSGLLVGSAVAVEYQAGIIAVVLLVVALRSAGRATAWFLLGTIPAALFIAFYQWRAFGAPWRLPYGYFAGTVNGTPIEVGYGIPGFHGFADAITGNYGLLLLSPVVLVGLVAAVLVALRAEPIARRHGMIALAVGVPYVALVGGWSGTATLETPGPRYLIPIVPFLAVPIAAAWRQVGRVALLAAAWGAMFQLAATFTSILGGQHEPVVSMYWHRIRAHDFSPTLWSMRIGVAGCAVYLVSVVLAAMATFSSARPVERRVTTVSG